MVWNGPEGDRIAADAGLTPANPVLPTGAAAVNRAGTALADWMTLDEYGPILERKRILIGLLAELIRLRDGHDAGARQRQLDAAMRLIEAGRNRPPTVAALAAAARL